MMDQMMGGFGGPMMRGGMGGMGGMGDMMAQMQQQGGGQFSSQVMVMSSSMGQDGKMHTERFVESSVNNGRGANERQQAYSNSRTGMDKMGLERNLHDRGRKVVKERNRGTGEERQTALFRGMEESQADQFDRDWHQQAGNLRHPNFASMLGAGTQGMIQGGHPGPMGGRPVQRGLEDRRFR